MKKLITKYQNIVFKEAKHTDFNHLKNNLFEDIDESKIENLSFNLLTIIQNPSDFKTFKANLLNRLDKIVNKYLFKNSLIDSKEERWKVLDMLFGKVISGNNVDEFIEEIRQYDSSKLLESNLMFFWFMIKLKPNEYYNWKKEIYEHFE
jgi:hypothetical protein